jgi:phosphatidylglycerophosphate synthase
LAPFAPADNRSLHRQPYAVPVDASSQSARGPAGDSNHPARSSCDQRPENDRTVVMHPILPSAARRDLGATLVVAVSLHAAAASALAFALGWGVRYAAVAIAGMSIAAVLVAWSFGRRHVGSDAAPPVFGAASRVTLLRLAIAMLLGATLVIDLERATPWLPWAMVGMATVAALLDTLDGPLARRSGQASPAGARFDMETDAWFTLVLSLLAWQLERAGIWVLASGAMRYAFVAAAWLWPWLARPLPASRRRQAVCVLQIVAFIVALAPIWPHAVSIAFCAIGLAGLAASFAADVLQLWRAHRHDSASAPGSRPGVERGPSGSEARSAVRLGAWLLRFAAAGFVLNTLLTFESGLHGRGVHWSPRLSLDLCVAVLVGTALFALLARRGGRTAPQLLTRRATSALAALCTLLVLVRYVDVTIPAFFGRPVNLYWDAPHAWQLLKLASSAWSPWHVIGGVAAVATLLAVLFVISRRAITVLADCLRVRPAWPVLAGVSGTLVASFAVYPFVAADTRWFFSLPVTPVVVRQAALLGTALARERTEAGLGPSPSFAANVDALHGADVLLIFAESYGISTFERPAQVKALAAAREVLLQAVTRSGRQVVSARVRSPTFGGGSWLAHATLLAGVDTQDPDDYALLLTTRRPTLVAHFARHGYRTIGWMPGMQRPWPEGSFYGFERYADANGVGYSGPIFGYWAIPDQASMALLHAQELGVPAAGGAETNQEAKRRPRFVVFPTLDTHAPFHPLAPYQGDWQRLLGAQAYTPAQRAAALAATQPQIGRPETWVDAYVQAVARSFEWLGDYLAEHASPALVTIVVGDHQALAAVSGADASWDVPVHVISADAALLDRLRSMGFGSGLVPAARPLGGMHELTALLVRAFDVPRVDVAGPCPTRQ